MHIPNKEGKVCDAVVKVLEKWTGKTRTNVRRPDKDHTVPDDRRVDLRLRLGAQEYAIEHRRVEPFENEIMTNIRFTKRHGYIKDRVSDSLPGPAYYVLEIPVDFRLPANRKEREEELNALIVWIQMSAHTDDADGYAGRDLPGSNQYAFLVRVSCKTRFCALADPYAGLSAVHLR